MVDWPDEAEQAGNVGPYRDRIRWAAEEDKRNEGSCVMMGWYDDGLGWGVWIVMSLMMLAFWALLIFGGIAVYRSVRRDDGRPPNSRGGAERLLDERFARGEIDADEYTQRRELLRSGR